jgi:hypothetical protein
MPYKHVFISVGGIVLAFLLYLMVSRVVLICSPRAIYAPENWSEQILGDVFKPGIDLPYQYNDRKCKIQALQGHWELFLDNNNQTFGSLRITGRRIVFDQCGGQFSSLSYSEGMIRYEPNPNSELGNGKTWAVVNGHEYAIAAESDPSQPKFLAFRAPGDNASSLLRPVQK